MTGWDPELAADFPPTPSSHLASAFAALLTAEQGGAPRAPSSPPPAALSEDSIEEIVRRVLARMADDSMRQLVVETAERLVREEIERIKRG